MGVPATVEAVKGSQLSRGMVNNGLAWLRDGERSLRQARGRARSLSACSYASKTCLCIGGGVVKGVVGGGGGGVKGVVRSKGNV